MFSDNLTFTLTIVNISLFIVFTIFLTIRLNILNSLIKEKFRDYKLEKQERYLLYFLLFITLLFFIWIEIFVLRNF